MRGALRLRSWVPSGLAWASLAVGLLGWIGPSAGAQEPAPLNAAALDATTAGDASDPAGAAFFEQHVRPLLAEHCWACHGSNKQEAGLRLDSQADLLRGSDQGAVVQPGQPDESRLLLAVQRTDPNLQMPPEEALAPSAVEVLGAWIAAGAHWPAESAAPAATGPDPTQHWAFQRVSEPPLPSVQQNAWVRQPLDAFILARLEAAGLAPSPAADRRVLIRRLSYDLLGLPPTAEEVQAFVDDPAPDAYERLVERLLASPAYGERWARHWLDVARYADSKGYKFFGTNESFGWTYRDWVIRALNEDLPYDQFLVAQLAADQLPLGEDTRPLAALGFLTGGRRFLEDMHDILDDRIDVVARGLLGLTVGCARCHDHKFDPIPMADYYSLYGVFAASVERTRSVYPERTLTDEQRAYEEELAVREQALDELLVTSHAQMTTEFRNRVGDYLLAGKEALARPAMDKFMFVEVPGQLSQLVTSRWRALLDRTARTHDPVFAPWHALAALSSEQFAGQAPALVAQFAANDDPQRPLLPSVAALFAGPPPQALAEVAARYTQLFAGVETRWQAEVQAWRATGQPGEPAGFASAEDEVLRSVLYGPLAPPDVPLADTEMLGGRELQGKVGELRGKVEEYWRQAPPGTQRAMILEESPALYKYQPLVFLRGKPSNPGPSVPRQFLSIVAGPDRQPFTHGGGRLELAQAIASPDNPLTARVFVNRVWLTYFTAGLVNTPSDFGLRSDPPTHPELLDYLAARFMREGWSLKQLHRQIVLSATYQQVALDRPEARAIDPENRLLWRMPRKRLDWEALRDTLLAASGQLDQTLYGPALQILAPPYPPRRTIYGFIDRGALPGVLSTFDFANPDTHAPQRFQTTVPQQGLYLLNHPFVWEQAQRLAERFPLSSPENLAAQTEALYETLFARPVSAEEVELARAFLAQESPAAVAHWQYGYGAYDETAQRVTQFAELTHFTGQRWQGGPQLPDPLIGWVFFEAGGGHPGLSPDYLAIRRWTAPQAGVVRVRGELIHESEGNGIAARIVSSRAGQLGAWEVQRSTVQTDVDALPVEAGETLDFVVACRDDLFNDQHRWAPVIELTAVDGSLLACDAQADFRLSTQTSRWTRYVHALLLTNELTYVD